MKALLLFAAALMLSMPAMARDCVKLNGKYRDANGIFTFEFKQYDCNAQYWKMSVTGVGASKGFQKRLLGHVSQPDQWSKNPGTAQFGFVADFFAQKSYYYGQHKFQSDRYRGYGYCTFTDTYTIVSDNEIEAQFRYQDSCDVRQGERNMRLTLKKVR